MLTKRIIPCLDVQGGRTVKGVNFKNLADAGDPVELAEKYSREGADELVFLDISATREKRETLAGLVRDVASRINIPFTVGGGIRSVQDVDILLQHGADKVAINSAAVTDPDLIGDLAAKFGSQCIVLAVDAKRIGPHWKVWREGGNQQTSRDLFAWAREGQERGAGELLFTSMDHDGTREGFADGILQMLSEELSIPIIASGGAGKVSHFLDVFTKGNADAALAASVFHFNEISIEGLKRAMWEQKIPVRVSELPENKMKKVLWK